MGIFNKKPLIPPTYTLNLSTGIAQYSQRKAEFKYSQQGSLGVNTIDWTCVCNVSAISSALLYAGWVFPSSRKFARVPDDLANYIIEACSTEDNWFKTKMYHLWHNWYEGDPKAYTPLEINEVVAHYVCEYLKCSGADSFLAAVPIHQIFKQLYCNRLSVPTSVAWGGLAGHIICLVGFEATSEKALQDWFNNPYNCTPPIKNVIIDDPYGYFDWKTGKYNGALSGNDLMIPFDFFCRHWKSVDNPDAKFAHMLGKPAAIC